MPPDPLKVTQETQFDLSGPHTAGNELKYIHYNYNNINRLSDNIGSGQQLRLWDVRVSDGAPKFGTEIKRLQESVTYAVIH